MTFIANKEQRAALLGLAYWIADSSYMRERFPNDPEQQVIRETIHSLFDELDALRVPYWVQNTIICFAEDWRRYRSQYIDSYIKERRIII